MSGLIYVVWELTLRCDLACGHCGSRAGKARPDELSTAEALDLVRQVADMGAREVTLIGGEAYLRDDWHVIARAIRDRGMSCTMTTGGRGLSLERARLAREAGIESVSVSIDGIGPTHDLQRGVAGSFESARAAMRNVREVGIPLAANTQVNRLSFPELDAVLDLLIEHRVHGWQVQLTVPQGRAAERPEWLVQPYDVLEVIPRIAALKERGLRHGLRLYPGNNVGYFGPHEALLRGDGARPAHTTGCTAGMHTLGIEADGAIKGCPSLPTAAYVGGNIRDRPLREIWDATPELRFARDRTAGSLHGFCRTCYYADECRGGCTWTAHVYFGRAGDNPFCHHRALELARLGRRERVRRVAPAPGRPFDHGVWELIEEPLSGGDHGPRDLPAVPPSREGDRARLPVL